MNNRYAQSKLEYIDLLFTYFQAIELDVELKSHIAKYLTVLISGVYEDIIKTLLKESIQKESLTTETRNFIFKQIDIIFRNPTHKNINNLFNRFNKEWLKSLKEKISGQNWEALNSIVNNKNNIAHGNSSEITFQDILEFYKSSKIIMTQLDDLFCAKVKS